MAMALLQDVVPRGVNLFMNLVGGPLLLLFLPAVATVSLLATSLSHALSYLRQLASSYLSPSSPYLPLAFSLTLREKVVVITGASSGIGRSMALEYARRGAALVLAARRQERLQEVAKACRAEGAPVALVKRTDVTHDQQCRELIEFAVQELGRIDVLVNNAGTAHSGLVESYKHPQEFTSVMVTDFWGNVWPTLHALPHLRKSQGQVFVTASAAAFLTYPRQAFYNAAKAAVVQFYDTLRVELPPSVAVTIALPGFIKSEMTTSASASSHIPWYWPMLGTEAAAYHMVDAAERRQHYVFTPLWYTTWLPYRMFAPEIMDWSQRVLMLGRAPSSAVQELLAAAVGEEATEKLFSSMSSLPAAAGH